MFQCPQQLRHLSADQRAVLALDVLPALEKEARERQGTRTDIVPTLAPSERGKARDKAAALVGVGHTYISDMKKLASEEPKLAAEIRSGEETIQGAKRKIKERQREAVREENRRLVESGPSVLSHVAGERYQTSLCCGRSRLAI